MIPQHASGRQMLASLEQAYQARKHRAIDARRRFAYQIEKQVKMILESLGYIVSKPTSAIEHYDLLAHRPGEPAAVRVEVKAARHNGRRYQAQLRSNDADVLIMACVGDGGQSFFVIPFDQVTSKTLDIYTSDPSEYTGKYSGWLDAWNVLEERITAGCNSWQMGLGLEVH